MSENVTLKEFVERAWVKKVPDLEVIDLRDEKAEVNLLKKVRIEIAINKDFVQPTIDAIVAGARTGNIGDGKIFVLPLEQCVRIRTGEEGNDAIG